MKFRVKDEDGKDYTVEEVIEKTTEDEDPVTEELLELTQEEIKNLKDLAANAPKILELLAVEDKEHAENPELVDADEDEDDKDDEDILEDDGEEVLETEEKMTHDSKKSFGSIEKENKMIDDSLTDTVSEAWAKRYNGGKN